MTSHDLNHSSMISNTDIFMPKQSLISLHLSVMEESNVCFTDFWWFWFLVALSIVMVVARTIAGLRECQDAAWISLQTLK
jgi:hypothetical protein